MTTGQSNEVTLKINGEEHAVDRGFTVLQACEQAGIEIPRFCYHDRLSIAGNCRMCLVEIKPGPPKPQASCAMPVQEGQEITTNSDMIKKAREGVMEFLLINHPLDCPICDQGGECDLQDQAMGYGTGLSRYDEHKRAVKNKEMGPLINTIMTRCIHCTRCVRFITEIAGVDSIGLLNRGENAEISSLEKAVNSELSANVIDLCPVGALTSKPYAFNARPWELKKTESIDVMDAVGSNIRIDTRGNEVLRILPRLNEEINEEWIADKTRYVCDGLGRQRLDKPYVRAEDGKLKPVTWPEAMAAIAKQIGVSKGSEIAAMAGDLIELESLYALKGLMKKIGSTAISGQQDGMVLDDDQQGDNLRASYLFNPSIAGIEDADALLIINSNPRWEAPLVNARIRKRWLRGKFPIALVGEAVDLTYDYDHLGDKASVLNELASGKHPFIKILKTAKRPIIMIGGHILAREDGQGLLSKIAEIADKTKVVTKGWNGWAMLHRHAARVGGLDINFAAKKGSVKTILNDCQKGKIKTVWLHGADDIDMKDLGEAFVIYQGHHGDSGAHRANVILPGAAYSEKAGTYVNTEGRVQMAYRAAFPPGEAKEDWAIIRAVSAEVGKDLPYDNLSDLRKAMRKEYPHLIELDCVPNLSLDVEKLIQKDAKISSDSLSNPIKNYYMTCTISRASKVMADCTRQFIDNHKTEQDKTGTDG